ECSLKRSWITPAEPPLARRAPVRRLGALSQLVGSARSGPERLHHHLLELARSLGPLLEPHLAAPGTGVDERQAGPQHAGLRVERCPPGRFDARRPGRDELAVRLQRLLPERPGNPDSGLRLSLDRTARGLGRATARLGQR